MINCLIVGCGRIFAKHLEAFHSLKDKIKLVAICDIDKKVLKNLKHIKKIPFYNSIEKAIIKTNPDLVIILTPSGLHAKNALIALKYKKHVIIEKPMCLKISDAKKIIHLSKKVKKKAFVVMQNKFNLPVIKLREDIRRNNFGRIFHASVIVRWMRDYNYYNQAKWRGTWKYDGGVISNQASHHLDLLRTIMGNPVSVFAKSSNYLSQIEAEDTALIIFKFEKKKTAIMEATTAMRPKNIEGSISIMGTKGSAKIGGFAMNKIEYYYSKKKISLKKYNTYPKNVYGYGHTKFYEHVIESVAKNFKSEFECTEALKTVQLINAIYKSIENKKEIFLKKEKIVSSRLGI